MFWKLFVLFSFRNLIWSFCVEKIVQNSAFPTNVFDAMRRKFHLIKIIFFRRAILYRYSKLILK